MGLIGTVRRAELCFAIYWWFAFGCRTSMGET